MRDRIISQLDMRIHKLQETLRKEWGLKVGRSICYRAKMNVIAKFLGDWKLEFSRLLDYADMIKSTNPESSCWVKLKMKQSLAYTCLNIFMFALLH